MLPQYAHQSILQFQTQNVAAPAARPSKEGKTKAKKDAKKDGSSSNSDDDLEIEEPPEARPTIISDLKPTDQAGKLLWEVVDAVWSPHNKPASADKIRTAVAFVGEAVRGLRDQWKSQNEQLKKAELPNSDTASQAASLKAAVSAHRDTMERLVARVTQYGHPWILKRYVSLSPPPLQSNLSTVLETMPTAVRSQPYHNRNAFMRPLAWLSFCLIIIFHEALKPTMMTTRMHAWLPLDSVISCQTSALQFVSST